MVLSEKQTNRQMEQKTGAGNQSMNTWTNNQQGYQECTTEKR